MDTTEMWKKNADRAMALFEQKSPEQLAVELVEMRDKHTAAMDALSRMQDQRDQLAVQLKDSTGQRGVMAELLREAAQVLRSTGALCDAIPTRLQNHEDETLANIGLIVNEHGLYHLVRNTEDKLNSALSGKLSAFVVPDGWQLVPHLSDEKPAS